ncbi:Agamous-like MADS-box protein [Actinidia chinensis var. chinensis]|uniref:Agamous-like MADS-box protein n=1 Tax=Actinidia chinensis var. chinensis TaxID=1590841 RepID=A0A2R6RCW1_ACTCC|nr:Agamous-like MADS-box protein [Actinidia chinensis var. chinensis]
MARRKVKLAFMTKAAARKASLKKRKRGLFKKVDELSTLCDVDACAIIFSPSENDPEVWPSPLGAQEVIMKFRTLPVVEQTQKMVNLHSFCRKSLTKSESQHRKQQRENHHKELINFMYGCLVGREIQYLNIIDSRELGSLLNLKITDASRRIEFLKQAVNIS